MAGSEEDVKVCDERMHIIIPRGHQCEGRLRPHPLVTVQYLACSAMPL